MRPNTFASIVSSLTLLLLGIAGAQESDDNQADILQSSGRAAKKGQFAKTKKVMGYYPSYNADIQSPEQLNYDLYTDVTFFVAVPEKDYTFSYGDLSKADAEDLAKRFVKETKKHGVNSLLSIGGWTGSRHFSTLTASQNARKKFASALVNYAKQLGFGGIDVDWEYPNAEGIGCNSRNVNDTVHLGLLLHEIRSLWPDAQLTAALSINGLIGASGSAATKNETALIVKYLNFANLMAYDVFGAWAEKTGPIAPIRNKCAPDGYKQSVETGIAVLLEQGFQAHQIVLGIPAYAKRLQLVSPKLTAKVVDGKTTYYYQEHTKETPPGGKTDDKPGKDVCGAATTWGGAFLVNELIQNGWLSKDQKSGLGSYERYYDECSGQPFLTNGTYFISYDDIFSTVDKAKVAKSRSLAGVYFFDTEGAPDATIKAARQAL